MRRAHGAVNKNLRRFLSSGKLEKYSSRTDEHTLAARSLAKQMSGIFSLSKGEVGPASQHTLEGGLYPGLPERMTNAYYIPTQFHC